MKTLKFLFSDLNQDERQFLGGLVIFISAFVFLFWLASTNTYPNVDAPCFDTQVDKKTEYRLPKFYSKYVNKIYNETK